MTKLRTYLLVAIIVLLSGISPTFTEFGGVDIASIALGLALLVFIKPVFVALIKQRYRRFLIILIFFQIVFCASSLLWTEYVQRGSYEIITLILASYIAVGIASTFSLYEFVRILAISTLIVAVISLLLWLVAPQYALMSKGELKGIYLHKNALGRVVGYGLIACAIMWRYSEKRQKTFYALGVLLCTAVLLLSRSASPLVGAALVLCCFLFYQSVNRSEAGKLQVLKYLNRAILIFPVIPFLLVYITPVTDFMLVKLGRNVDFNTIMIRESLWNYLRPDILDRWLIGHGVGSIWEVGGTRVPVLGSDFRTGWFVKQAHNGYIELYLQYGLIGTLIFVALFLYFRVVNLQRINRSLAIVAWVFFGYFLLLNNSYAANFTQLTMPWMISLCMFLYLSVRDKAPTFNRW